MQSLSGFENCVAVDRPASSANNSHFSSGSAARVGTEIPPPDNAHGRELSFHHGQLAVQQPNDMNAGLCLADGHDGLGTFAIQGVKWPNLTSNRNSDLFHDIDEIHDGDCNDNGLTESPGIAHLEHAFEATPSHNEGLISPSASSHSSTPVVSAECPSGRSHCGGEAISHQPDKAGENWPSFAVLQKTNAVSRGQYTMQSYAMHILLDFPRSVVGSSVIIAASHW